MKIALVHDFLKEYGGAERVLETLHEMWPEAPIYTAFIDYDGLGPHSDRIKKWQIKTSWLQNIPGITKIYSPLRFLAPKAFTNFDFSGFDIVISSTNAYYAKAIIVKPPAIHICYCHTPPRSLYGYATRMNWQKNIFTNIYGQIINHFLRLADFKMSQKVNYFIANSIVVKRRIEKFYRRDATVIYPPVELNSKNKNQNSNLQFKIQNGNYYLYVGKLAMAKNVNLAIEAAKKLGLNLKIAGKGGEEDSLRQLANGKTEFLGEVNDEEIIDLYKNCKAVIFPAVDEDFGIVPVEAMSFGKPVVAYKSGGVVETVIDGKTGVFFDQPTAESLVEAIKKLEKLSIKPQDCINQANKFSKEVFIEKIKAFVTRVDRT